MFDPIHALIAYVILLCVCIVCFVIVPGCRNENVTPPGRPSFKYGSYTPCYIQLDEDQFKILIETLKGEK